MLLLLLLGVDGAAHVPAVDTAVAAAVFTTIACCCSSLSICFTQQSFSVTPHVVKADECHEQPHVSLSQLVAYEVAAAAQHGLNTVKGVKQLPAAAAVAAPAATR